MALRLGVSFHSPPVLRAGTGEAPAHLTLSLQVRKRHVFTLTIHAMGSRGP